MQTDMDDRPGLEDLEAALAADAPDLKAFLATVHPADLATWIIHLERADRQRILFVLDDEEVSELLSFADESGREELLAELSIEQMVKVVEELPADDVVDLLASLDEERAESILRAVDFERAQGLRRLARYDEETVGGLMTTDYVAVHADTHVGDAIKLIRTEEGPAAEEEGGVFVMDEDGKPVGHLSDRELLTTPIHTPVRDVMETDLISIGADEDQEAVAQLVHKYEFPQVPVVDGRGVLIGVVSADDALDVLQEEAEEDILRIVGTSPQEQTRLTIWTRVRHRLPLQALTVLGGLVTAYLLGLALPESEGSEASSILRYLPIIIGLAGNVGVQSSTILVRAMATGELERERGWGVLGSEVIVGVTIGLICGLVTMGVAWGIETNVSSPALFAVALGGAISVAVAWAAFLGCAVPISCERLGIDPAIVAGPFLITLSDISGAAIFIAVASIVLDLGP